MNETIIDFLTINPKLYAESTSLFWNDEHISKGMLAAHLNEDIDAASRKIKTINQSVRWICDQEVLPIKNRKLLDLGCGIGLYAEKLAKEGFEVTGIDLSKRSIEYAKAHQNKERQQVNYIEMNYLDMDFTDEFDVIIMIYCDFGVLRPEDRTRLLKKVYQALKRDGKFILDVFTDKYQKSFKEEIKIKKEEGGFWSEQPYVVIQRNKLYHETNNTLESYLVFTEQKTECYYIWNQLYTKQAFQKEMESSGFFLRNCYDDCTGKKFTGNDETLCATLMKIKK